MRDFADQGSVDLREPQDRFTRQGRREDHDRSDRVSEADPHRVHVMEARSFQDDRMNDVQRNAAGRELFANALGTVTA